MTEILTTGNSEIRKGKTSVEIDDQKLDYSYLTSVRVEVKAPGHFSGQRGERKRSEGVNYRIKDNIVKESLKKHLGHLT